MSINGSKKNSNKRKRRAAVQHAKTTAWNDHWEWQSVGQGLARALDLMSDGRIVVTVTDETRNQIQDAINMCELWKARSCGPMPHAVECSYSLAQLLYTDAAAAAAVSTTFNAISNNANYSENILQLSYSTVIIRSVNGLADRLQQQRRFSAPISQLCALLGLPRWIVDVRHEAAHNQLPPITQLRLAAHTLLGFFHERYWSNREGLLNSHAHELLEAHVDPSSFTLTKSIKKPLPADDNDDFDGEDDWLKSNYFASLFSKKTKDDNNAEKVTPAKETTSKDFAQQFVTTIPQDVAYQVAVDFFIWSDKGGIFVSSSSSSNENDSAVYKSLLMMICQTWPGLVATLVTHIVEYRLLHPFQNQEPSFALGGRKLPKPIDPMVHWMQVLLVSFTAKNVPIVSLLARLNTNDSDENMPLRRLLQRYCPKVTSKSTGRQQVKKTTKTKNWDIVDNWDASTIGCLPGCAV